MGTAFDNNNPVVWRLGPRSAKDGIYLAMTDNPTPIRFNISDLSTIGNSEKKPFLCFDMYLFHIHESITHKQVQKTSPA